MNAAESVPARIIGSAGKENNATLPVRLRGYSVRLASSFGCWGLSWAVAVPLLFVPIVHFFAVPALILGGPIGAVFLYRWAGSILPTSIACPDCKTDFEISRRRLSFPVYLSCPSCGQRICVESAS